MPEPVPAGDWEPEKEALRVTEPLTESDTVTEEEELMEGVRVVLLVALGDLLLLEQEEAEGDTVAEPVTEGLLLLVAFRLRLPVAVRDRVEEGD